MDQCGTPRQNKHDKILERKPKSPRIKDRVYVQFEDEIQNHQDEILKYTDESEAYSNFNTRGHFTANPLAANGQSDIKKLPNTPQLPESGRTFDFFSPEKHINEQTNEDGDSYDRQRMQTLTRQSHGLIADRGHGRSVFNQTVRTTTVFYVGILLEIKCLTFF